MRYYIAGKYTAKERLRLERDRLERGAHCCTSRWLDHNLTEEDTSDEIKRKEAIKDEQDVFVSDCLIMDTFDESMTGGREVEFGMARATGITIALIGPVRNVFHLLANKHYETWEAFHAEVER